MNEKYNALFTPWKIGNVEIKNRIVQCSMGGTSLFGWMEPNHFDKEAAYFLLNRAQDGVGLILPGMQCIRDPLGIPGRKWLYQNDQMFKQLKEYMVEFHKTGAKLFIQLAAGMGRSMAINGWMTKLAKNNVLNKIASPIVDVQYICASASEVPNRWKEDVMSRPLTVKEIEDMVYAFGQTAKKLRAAGIDGVEIHAVHEGYLLDQFTMANWNHRTDKYGGSFENRVRYALEVVAAIKEAAPQLMVEYKLPVIMENPDGTPRGKGGLQPDEACEFAKLLEGAGIDMIQVAQANHTGNMGDTIPPMGAMPYNWTLPVAERVKALVSVPVATVGRVVSVEAGEKILEDGSADIIAYGRSLMCDPDIALKAATGEPIRECLNCNKGCVDAIQNRKYISCVLNAENGDEATIAIKPGEGDKKIAVVGGGIAGLEAARVAAKRGYDVTVYEASDHLGGQIVLAAAPPRKDEIMRSVEYYEKILPGLGVKVELNHAATAEDLNAADAAIVAVGAHDVVIPVPGADSEKVVSSWDVLAGKVELTGRVAVIGGGLVGTETAEYLLQHGCEVAIVEMLDKIAAGESETILPLIMSDFAEHNVEQHVKTRLTAITDEGVEAVRTTEDGAEEPVKIACDYVVMAVGSKANAFDLDGVTVPVTCVGDCSGERTADIASAIRTAYHAANEL